MNTPTYFALSCLTMHLVSCRSWQFFYSPFFHSCQLYSTTALSTNLLMLPDRQAPPLKATWPNSCAISHSLHAVGDLNTISCSDRRSIWRCCPNNRLHHSGTHGCMLVITTGQLLGFMNSQCCVTSGGLPG